MTPSTIAIAKNTIQLQADSILKLLDFINEEFEKAVDLIHNSTGRVVISGIGKSAIIAQKIVATLNSTGTPSLFMHAADAIHGDLGMIQEEDIVVIISKSGESPEIKVLIPLIRNFKNLIISIVGNTKSFLALNSDLVLNTTVQKEACPNNLAPTTSTTAQLVMGDALAVSLMELNGFSGRDFAKYHPGGNLGKRLYLRVEDLYVQNERPCVNCDTSLKEVIIEITAKRLGVTAVVNEDKSLRGIITDGDLRRMLENTNDLTNVKAIDIATINPKTIKPAALAIEAFEVFKKLDISHLLVVSEKDEYLGVLHLHDLVREGIV